jgi:4-amino-4-deoxy-L-arabinose transferase-like glycosyltransferase
MMPAGMFRRSMPTLASISVAVFCVSLACVAAMGPARHLGATADEGGHIGPGLQWWIEHRFAYEPLTPPLARMAVSFLPWMWGFHSQGQPEVWSEARAVIANSGDPHLLLLLARIGTLVFLVWSSAAVWLLGRRAGGLATAAAAVACFVTLPPIIGNAGIATTDIAHTATFATLIYVFMRFVETPSRRWALLLGLAGALALVTKFTSIVFFPVCVVGLLGWRRIVADRDQPWLPGWQAVTRAMMMSVPVALLVIWAVYNFRVGSLLFESPIAGMQTAPLSGRGVWYDLAGLGIYPANEFWRGLLDGFHRSSGSPPDYLFGRLRPDGTRLFLPVGFLLKTPLHFLLLTLFGIVIGVTHIRRSRNWAVDAPWIVGLCVIGAAMFSVPHLGVRYILSAYLFFSVTAGVAVVAIWNATRMAILGRAAVMAATLWAGFIVIGSRRDYLGWFNLLAGSDPTWFISGVDTDYGQYGVFLAERLKALGVSHVFLMLTWDPAFPLAYYGINHNVPELTRLGVPPFTRLPPDTPVKGWIAITVESLQNPHFEWLKKFTPVDKVSYEIYIYHIDQ